MQIFPERVVKILKKWAPPCQVTFKCSPPGPGTRTRPKPSNLLSYADPKFKNVKQVMSELSQYHPELGVGSTKRMIFCNRKHPTRCLNLAK